MISINDCSVHAMLVNGKHDTSLYCITPLSRCRSRLMFDAAMKKLRGFLRFDASSFGYVACFWHKLLAMAFPAFAHMTLDAILCAIVEFAIANQESEINPLFDSVEFAAGCGNLTKGLIRLGFRACALDILYSHEPDCLSSRGLRLWILSLCHCCRRASLWFGTKCSSFVAICASVAQRSRDNNFFGDMSREFVRQGNSLVLLFALGAALDHHTTLEQPTGSCMPEYPVMKSALLFFSCKRSVTYLGAFGSRYVKPLQLLSTMALDKLARDKPEGDHQLAERGPNGEYTGKKKIFVKVNTIQCTLAGLALQRLQHNVPYDVCRSMSHN